MYSVLNFIVLVSFVFSAKNLLMKQLLRSGVSISQVLFYGGLAGFLIALTISLLRAQPMRPQKNQTLRFTINGLTWLSATSTFAYLHVSSVAMVSKAVTPLLILVAAIAGTAYSRRQILFAAIGLCTVVLFVLYGRQPDESIIGYCLCAATIILMIADFFLLKQATVNEPLFVVAATPACAFMAFGCIGILLRHEGFGIALLQVLLATGMGLCFYVFYALSIKRYKILPLGLSETPSILAAYILALAEYFIWGSHLTFRYFALLTIVSACLLAIFRGFERKSGV